MTLAAILTRFSVLRRSILWCMMTLAGRRQRGGGAKAMILAGQRQSNTGRAILGKRYWLLESITLEPHGVGILNTGIGHIKHPPGNTDTRKTPSLTPYRALPNRALNLDGDVPLHGRNEGRKETERGTTQPKETKLETLRPRRVLLYSWPASLLYGRRREDRAALSSSAINTYRISSKVNSQTLIIKQPR
jgi:hypothetical protein